MSDGPDLSFVIPVRNDANRLRRCLASVQTASRRQAVEIVVADNGSTDDTAKVAAAAGATVIALPDRVVADVRNAGARATHGRLLAFVDADHELAPNWTVAAIEAMGDPGVAAAGCDYHTPADGTWVQHTYDKLRARPAGPTTVDWLPSGNLVVRREMFDRVGGFDASLESCEDVDFCRRVREAGGRLVADPALRSIHHGDPETLRALFLSELWRGRDNLRVTLRDRLTLRTVAGLCLTLLYLPVAALTVVGLALMPVLGPRLLLGALLLLLALIFVRTARLVRSTAGWAVRLRALPEAALVAAAYDSARAAALVVRASHSTRRKGSE